MKPTLCITEVEYVKAKDVFDAAEDFDCIVSGRGEAELTQAVREKNAFGVVVGIDAYKDALYSAVPRGGIIARFGVGHDGVDKDKATTEGVIVTNTPGVLDVSVAEHAIWLMGSLARKIPQSDKIIKDKGWEINVGCEMKGKTLLVMGCGGIGKKIAKIASLGLGMNVIGFDIAEIDKRKMKQEYGFRDIVNSLAEAVPSADFITIHIPSTEKTKHIINAEFFAKMKPSAFIVNTSRGAVLDELALYDAIHSKTIAGAGLDVYETEPYIPRDSERDLRKLSDVVLTPHIASSTREAADQMAMGALQNALGAYNKEYDKLDILNPKVIEKLTS